MLASLSRLQTLCDKQFNDIIPRSVAIFRPALPIVFCGVLHYPEMSGDLPWRTGSLSQNELYFLVPLERYREVDGREEFVEACAATPYILVDNPESVAAGRERFGMPKEPAEFSTDWNDLPWDVGTQRYLRVRSWEPSVTGHRLGSLLDVVYTAASSWQTGARDNDFPIALPTRMAPTDWLRFVEEVMQLAGRAYGPTTVAGTVARIQSYLAMLRSTQTLSLFSLRQFPDPERPGFARYQDLIAFRMKVSDVQSFGFLGQGPLRSQFQLSLRRSEIRPIARVLGLRVTQRSSAASAPGESFERVNAIAPFYAQTDVDLQNAERLCWKFSRGGSSHWRDPDGRPLGAPATARYNRFLGASGAAFLERQRDVPVLDLKFMMLAARRDAVEAVVAATIPRGAPIKVDLVGTREHTGLRFLLTKARPKPSDEQEELVWTDGTYLSISVPVRLETRSLTLRANLMLQEFTTNPFMVQSLREMLGEPTSHAEFSAGEPGWFASTREFAQVLRLSTMSIDRTASSALVVRSPLLDVFTTHAPDLGAECIEAEELRQLRQMIWPDIYKILPALSVGRVPWPHTPSGSVFDRVMLTHFTDAEPTGAGSAHAHPNLQHILRFHENETFPIARRMGLVSLARESALASKIMSDGSPPGRTRAVPVVAFGEAISRVRLSRFEVLWESTPNLGRRTAGGVAR